MLTQLKQEIWNFDPKKVKEIMEALKEDLGIERGRGPGGRGPPGRGPPGRARDRDGDGGRGRDRNRGGDRGRGRDRDEN